nr:M20 family metallopeptidase [Demetria terragena]
MTTAEQTLLDRIDKTWLIQATQRLVQARGQNPPGEEAETVAVLSELASERGLTVTQTEVAPGRENVAVRADGDTAGPGLLLLGHTDVVPIGDGWSTDPFGAEVRDGRIFGRGSTDMKGGLAACLEAMAVVRQLASELGAELTGPIDLLATVDEEEAGIGIRALIDSPPPARYQGCITAEPTDLQTVIAARGDAYLDIVVTGVAAHSGRPDDGRNAIYGAARIVAELRAWHGELAATPHELAGPATFNVGMIDGGQGTSIVPAKCHIQVDRRLLPHEDPAQVEKDAQARIDTLHLDQDGLTVELSLPMSMPGFETAPSNPFVCALDEALTAAGGPGHPLGGWTAACDGGFVARDWDVPVVVLGPGSVNDQAHRPDESVGVDEVVTAARAYALTAWRLLVSTPTKEAP